MSRRLYRAVTIFLNSPIVAGLVGASFGLVLANLSSTQRSGPPRWALVGIFLAAVLSAVFVYNRLQVVAQKVENLQDSTDLIRVDEQSGGIDIVVGLVENATVIRVIGRARQDQLSSPSSRQVDYVKATEAAARSGHLRVYRRITGAELKEQFRDHLFRLLDVDVKGTGQIVEVAIVPNIDAMVSYQAFDRTAALIGIETAPVPGIRDSTVVFLTYQKEIIEALVAHFDSAWAGLDHVSSRGDFELATMVAS
jgi:hypothetical protein